MNQRNAAKQYGSVGLVSGVEDSSPHRLIQMLMDGALTRMAMAIGHMQRGDVAAKGESISTAISIIGGLQGSLDLEKGGQIAADLERLYDYISRRLVQANLENDLAPLEEARGLLNQVKEGWDEIPSRLEKRNAS